MRVALIHPPTCDPTAPYVALPLLAAVLRRAGHEVVLVDANVEAYHDLLRAEVLADLARRVGRRRSRLERRPALTHGEQLAYTTLWNARGDAESAPGAIAEALAVLRDGARFYDPHAYGAAVATVSSALSLISAAYAPLELSFAGYRSPFSLLDLEEIAADARPERNPFHDTFVSLGSRLQAARVQLVGVSMVFPGQIQPGYALALGLRAALPGVPIVAGGPALSQILLRHDARRAQQLLGPLHAAVILEGEDALVDLVDGLGRGRMPSGVIRGTAGRALDDLPAPDFDGLPWQLYLAPEPVLPYDLSRGCYWGRCAFCHYGLCERGAATYRERPVAEACQQIDALGRRFGARLFYLSQDSIAPRALLSLARAASTGARAWRFSTDVRPEPYFTAERSRELARGGALSVSLGVESAAPRVLALMDKGLEVEGMRRAIENLSAAGVATEAMCFTGFPTETEDEALATVAFLEELQDRLSLFICGEFALTHGSAVAARPQAFGLREVWSVAGDALGTALFYEPSASCGATACPDGERRRLDAALERLSRRFLLRRYPWAGSLSTAHTMLWTARCGPGVFRELAGSASDRVPGAAQRRARARFDLGQIAGRAVENESRIWSELVYERRQVSRAAYRELARGLPAARPSPCTATYAAGEGATYAAGEGATCAPVGARADRRRRGGRISGRRRRRG